MSNTQETLSKLISAANAVVERWETPAWKEAKPTASYVHELRDAVKAMECADHSDTPETDAFFARTDIDWDMEVQFARKLELERNESIQSFNVWQEDYKDMLAERNSLMCALLQIDSKADNSENVWETLGQISVIAHDTLNLHNKF